MSKTNYKAINPFTGETVEKKSSRDFTHVIFAKFAGDWWTKKGKASAERGWGTFEFFTGVKDPVKKAQSIRREIRRGDWGEASEIEVKVVELNTGDDSDDSDDRFIILSTPDGSPI